MLEIQIFLVFILTCPNFFLSKMKYYNHYHQQNNLYFNDWKMCVNFYLFTKEHLFQKHKTESTREKKLQIKKQTLTVT